MNIAGKKIIVLGAGRSGRAAAVLACSKGAIVEVYDSNPQANFSGWPELAHKTAGISEVYGLDISCDILIISPGIDPEITFAKSFAKNAGEFIGETEFAARYYSGTIIGITGTNGKTTTTELIQRILNHNGISCKACGNYGVPLSEIVMMERAPDVIALELSSFQLETVKDLHVNVAIWLNFSADHMDRYDSIESYFEAKINIFMNQDSGDLAIIRLDQDISNIKAKTITFSSESNAADYYLDKDTIYTKNTPIVDMNVTNLRGSHNAENVMSALAACHSLGISYNSVTDGLKGIKAPSHRCEIIRILNNVTYINDSKATNIDALENAIKAQTRPLVLILGGKEKGLSYRNLLPLLEKKTRLVIVYGEVADKLNREFGHSVSTEVVENLDQAVPLAHQRAKSGDVILLSPGTSSFDQFEGYEARGNYFSMLVNALN